MATLKPAAFAAFSLFLAACGKGDDTRAEGTGVVVISTESDADILLPPLVRQSTGRQVIEQVFDRLADLAPKGFAASPPDFTPRLARRWEWSDDSLAIAFFLDTAALWHDGRPVRAVDVAFTFSVYSDPLLHDDAAGLSGIDSVSVQDEHTAVFWFSERRPEQFFDAAYRMFILPEHLLGAIPANELATSSFSRAPVGSGPFRFTRWQPDVTIELEADTSNYRGRPALSRVVWRVAANHMAAVARVASGEADFHGNVQRADLDSVRRNPELRAVFSPGGEYSAIVFNFRERKPGGAPHPIFSNHAMRMAFTMAIDREGAVRSFFDTLAFAAAGPFVRGGAVVDTVFRTIPYDAARAARILDSLGWRRPAGAEFRQNGNRPLEFGLLVPSTSRARLSSAWFVKEELKKAGVNMIIEEADFSAFMARVAAGDFDSYYGAWQTTLSPAALRDTWGGRGSEGTGWLNHGAYEGAEMTAFVDAAILQLDPVRARQLYRRAYQKLIDDAPAIWMYELRNVAMVHSRIRVPDFPEHGWWTTLSRWSLDPARGTPRTAGGGQ